MRIEQELKTAIEAAHRRAIVDTIRAHPQMTLAELAKASKKNGLASITIGDIIARPSSMVERRPTPAVDTRTPRARARYEKALVAALAIEGGWARAYALRALAGGTPLQARKALGRLVSRGEVQWRGEARATEYRLSAGGKKPRAKMKTSAVATRTASGRANYDQAVLSTLDTRGEMSAEQLRAVVGGTPTQLRAAVHRLVAAGSVKARGRARATKYRVQ